MAQLQSHLAVNKSILNSSKGKDIVIVIGTTGAGKSTTLNLLCDKRLKAEHGKLLLADTTDASSFTIGGSHISQTSLP